MIAFTYIAMTDRETPKNSEMYVQVGANGDPVKIGKYGDPNVELREAALDAGVGEMPIFRTPWIVRKGMISVPRFRMEEIFGGSE